MPNKVKRTYSLDQKTIDRLAELAQWQRRNMSAQVAALIDEAYERERERRAQSSRVDDRVQAGAA